MLAMVKDIPRTLHHNIVQNVVDKLIQKRSVPVVTEEGTSIIFARDIK